VKHEEAWQRLPDLLDDRDCPDLLAHVRGCAACQRQLFLLGRVDRILRQQVPAGQPRRYVARVAAVVAAAACVAASLVVFLPHGAPRHDFAFRTTSGRLVGDATMDDSHGRNVALTLNAHGLPLNRHHVFVLWAANERSSMEVGHFMVDRSGGCRVRFNLPATHEWSRFWVAQPGNATAVVAST
jgi:hypothetical protein